MTEIRLVRGDIAAQEADAIVNAANSGLLGGGGVDGALLRRGGPAQMEGRRRLRERIGELPAGQAAWSEPGDLAARWLIHVVGPVHSPREDRSAQLVSCYREALRVADELGARTVAFPSVSTGAYGWPIDDGARIAVRTVRSTPTQVEEVRFVLYDEVAFDAFSSALGAAAE